MRTLLLDNTRRRQPPKIAPRRPQDGPRRPQDGPRRPQDSPRPLQDAPKTPQDPPKKRFWSGLGVENGTKMQPQTLPKRGRMRSAEILENRRQYHVFEGFSLPTWLPKLLQNTSKMASENAPRKRSKNQPSKYLKMDPRMPPKTPQEGPRRPKDASRRPQAPPKTAPRPSKDAPGSAQGAAGASKGALRVAPRSAQEASKIGFSPRSPPRRPIWARFGAVLGSIWGRF